MVEVPVPVIGQAVPATNLLDTSGRTVTVEEVLRGAGGRSLVLAFLKTTCPTCKLAWPYMEKLHKRYGKAAARVVGVCQDDEEAGRRFYAEFGNATFERFLDPAPGYPASNAFAVESVPHVVLVSRDGVVRQVFSGWQRQALEELGKWLAEDRRLPHARLIEINDPVPPWKPG